eukprot:3192269-Amphidinium_carterae.1
MLKDLSLQVAAVVPATLVRSTTHPADDSSFLTSGDRGVGKTPYSSIEKSSPEVAVRAGRVHAAPAFEGEGGGEDDSP